jgi:NAD(P)-dependent dehydrogenase (short-subunit alcohol dehydrogenase family)
MNRTVLITGATRGIGRELTKQLSALDFTVFATGRDHPLLTELKDQTGCLAETCDLSDAEDTRKLYTKAKSLLGQVDVLINNAGFNPGKEPIDTLSPDHMDASYAVNFRAPFILAQQALRDMRLAKRGHILNVISTTAKTSMENYAAYSAMKYALHGFTLCLIKEARQVNVKATGVYPGGVDTDFRVGERPDYLKPESAAHMIVQCITAPEDVVVHELVYRPMVETNF